MSISAIEILCTLGPSSMNERAIKRMSELGVSLFRLNLSHIPADKIEEQARFVMAHTSVPVCIDTEGPQIRTGYVENNGIHLEEGATIRLVREDIVGTAQRLHLRPEIAWDSLQPGDLVTIDFDSVLLSITGGDGEELLAAVICGGSVGSNKAVTVDRHIGMPILSNKDLRGVDVIRRLGLTQISLSFVDSRKDVEEVRELLGAGVRIIAKIETRGALKHLDGIIAVSDALLIDRGDLSREEPISKIPLLQRAIIERGEAAGRPVLVATNLLESMVRTRKPLRSEVNDIMSTLLAGAHGLVLAAETAIGQYPVECVAMVKRMIRYHEIAREGYSIERLLRDDSFLLVEPHGGYLVDQSASTADQAAGDGLPRIVVDLHTIMDAEQIGIGTYSPLTGFMTQAEIDAVLDTYRLPSGTVWTLPITLQIPREQFDSVQRGDAVALVLSPDGVVYATMTVSDRFAMDLASMAQRCFGTTSTDHPGVRRLFDKGDRFLGGEITLLRRLPSPFKEYEFTPRQTRLIFEHREWHKIAGFHTRNVVHRVHEFLQQSALERHHLDGVLVHPALGPKKTGDFEASIILGSYRVALEHYYPRGRFLLGAFSSYSRYAGPREAVFTALCRKNFGCSHFIMGRDHTGVGSFYAPTASIDLFRELGDIGIEPIVFGALHFCDACGTYVEECGHGGAGQGNISGTEGREMLRAGQRPPEWFLRDKVADMIFERIGRGESVFVD